MKFRRLVVLLILLPALPLLALDPFLSPEVVKQSVLDYKARVAVMPARPTHGLPLPLRLEMVRLPAYKADQISLVRAVAILQEAVDAPGINSGGLRFLIDPRAEDNDSRITLDLKDISVLEVLRYVTEIAGCGYAVAGQLIIVGDPEQARDTWRSLNVENFVLSDALARQWFSKAKGRQVGDKDPLWRAEADLDKLGIAFHPDAQADFVPWMNCLSVVHCHNAIECLRVLIKESEAKLQLTETPAGDGAPPPEGLIRETISLEERDLESLRRVLYFKDGLVHPDSRTTADVLRDLQVPFPEGGQVWLDRSARKLHLIQTEENLKKIRQVLALD